MLEFGLHFADIIAIGASTGGPDVIAKLLSLLPENLQVPVVITLHLNDEFSDLMEMRFKRNCKLNFFMAEENRELLPGSVYMAPGGKHLCILKVSGKLICQLKGGAPVNFCQPSVDVMAKSLAAISDLKVLFLMLSGMGEDGLEGVRALKKNRCFVITQTADSCVVYGMPKAIDQSQLSDLKLSVEDMSKFIEEKFILFSRRVKNVK